MTTSHKIRFACIALLWLALCYMVATGGGLPFMKVFVIVASGIVVFVPLYKKYMKK
ncbi:MAG: hypothetical protein J6L79_00335 [Muribaculaceae bacterium]|nr:hypothetical protein [Muribaculaceae bacterium]